MRSYLPKLISILVLFGGITLLNPINPAAQTLTQDPILSYNQTTSSAKGKNILYKKPVFLQCDRLDVSIPSGSEIPAEGTTIDVVVYTVGTATEYRLVRVDTNEVIAGPQASNQFEGVFVLPLTIYQAQVRDEEQDWTTNGCLIKYREEKEPVPEPPVCNSIDLSIPSDSEIPAEGTTVDVVVNAESATEYQIVRIDTGEVIAGPQASNQFEDVLVFPLIAYQAQVRNEEHSWTTEGCLIKYREEKEPEAELPVCNSVNTTTPPGSEIPSAGTTLDVNINADNATEYRIIRTSDGSIIAGPQADNRFIDISVLPDVTYQGQVKNEQYEWTTESCTFGFVGMPEGPDLIAPACISADAKLSDDTEDEILEGEVTIDVNVAAINATSYRIVRKDKNQVVAGPQSEETFEEVSINLNKPYQAQVRDENHDWSTEGCLYAPDSSTSRIPIFDFIKPTVAGQYQDFIGAVPFGTYTPWLEPGKEYFDSTQSIMFNIEYITANQGEVVFRFNGEEVPDITTSVFNNETFRQLTDAGSRTPVSLDQGITQLIAYFHDEERARIYQTISSDDESRWIHPLDQPFEHKYEFELELHGPPGVTDLLIYSDQEQLVQYDENGRAEVKFKYREPGLVAVYIMDKDNNVTWTAVESGRFPITTRQTRSYVFEQNNLHHYQIIDSAGEVVGGPQAVPDMTLTAEPGETYYAQLVYPDTSLFVGLYDDMKYEHPSYWLMPLNADEELKYAFQVEYHRQTDPTSENYLLNDVVIDRLFMTSEPIPVSQQFSYGRHDDAPPGVVLIGIPDASMVAFCQRPGYHEVVYWGGWENESYYLPERGIVFDYDLAKEWTNLKQADCIDAARRINLELARQGLRTDHTYRFHGERSQGYQMVQQNIWSPYNLAGMRPPHVGWVLKPGTVLPFYQNPDDVVFWGWNLDTGTLDEGIGAPQLESHITTLISSEPDERASVEDDVVKSDQYSPPKQNVSDTDTDTSSTTSSSSDLAQSSLDEPPQELPVTGLIELSLNWNFAPAAFGLGLIILLLFAGISAVFVKPKRRPR